MGGRAFTGGGGGDGGIGLDWIGEGEMRGEVRRGREGKGSFGAVVRVGDGVMVEYYVLPTVITHG